MAIEAGWRSKSTLFAAVLAIAAGVESHAAGQGTTTGVATFQAKGEVQEYKPGVVVWRGSFVGTSMTEARKGPLHNSGWECTGEVVVQEANSHRGAGFCLVTDPDGDTINLLWERTNVPGPAAEPKTKGTYLSGTGKYSGIQGYYTFACRRAGALSLCNITGGEYKLP